MERSGTQASESHQPAGMLGNIGSVVRGKAPEQASWCCAVSVCVVALAVVVLGGCGGGEPSSAPVARRYLAAWERGDYAAAARLTTSRPGPVVSM